MCFSPSFQITLGPKSLFLWQSRQSEQSIFRSILSVYWSVLSVMVRSSKQGTLIVAPISLIGFTYELAHSVQCWLLYVPLQDAIM